MNPELRNIDPTSIITTDERFARYRLGSVEISPTHFSPPPMFVEEDGLLPIAGHNRIIAAVQKGERVIQAFVFSANVLPPLARLELSLRNIAWHRPIAPLDKILAIGKAFELDERSMPDDALAKALGIEASLGAATPYFNVYKMGEAVLEQIRSDELSYECALACSATPKAERATLVGLMCGPIRPNLNTAKRIVENAVSVSIMKGINLRDLFKQSPLVEILKSSQPQPARTAEIDRSLQALRYPALTAQLQEVNSRIAKADLPKYVQITPPKNMEPGPAIIQIRAQTKEDLLQGAKAIYDAAEKSLLDDIFAKGKG